MSTEQKWQTEMRNPATTHIDRMTTAEMAACIQHEMKMQFEQSDKLCHPSKKPVIVLQQGWPAAED